MDTALDAARDEMNQTVSNIEQQLEAGSATLLSKMQADRSRHAPALRPPWHPHICLPDIALARGSRAASAHPSGTRAAPV